MKIYLNKKLIEIDQPMSLGQFLLANGIATTGIAVAVDRKVVSRDKWNEFPLTDSMDIIVINATCGG